MKEKYNWMEILTLILEELPLEQVIIYNKNKFCFKYIGDIETRIGYLLIWEVYSSRAVQISRVGVPDNFPMISFEDEKILQKEVPEKLNIESL